MSNFSKSVIYNKENNYIIINLNINPDFSFFVDIFSETMGLSESNHCFNILLDGSDVEKLPSLTTVYEIVKFEIKYFEWFKSTRRAYVIPEKIEKSFGRYSSILKNRGVKTKVFRAKKDAIDWLAKEG